MTGAATRRVDSARLLRWIGAGLVVLAVGILALREQSRLRCDRDAGRCELWRATPFGSQDLALEMADIQKVEVEVYTQGRPRRSTVVLVTRGEAVPFSSRQGRPPSDELATDLRRFLGGEGPDVLLEYDSLPELAPHAGIWGFIGLLMLGMSWLEGWMTRQRGVKVTER